MKKKYNQPLFFVILIVASTAMVSLLIIYFGEEKKEINDTSNEAIIQDGEINVAAMFLEPGEEAHYNESADLLEDSNESEEKRDVEEIEIEEQDEFLYPSDTKIITYKELDYMTREEIAYIRNEIYARHGYVFSSEQYREYFGSKSWYIQNENFDEQLFNSFEEQNKEIISAYEREKGWR